jgi:hypothetical protein
MGVDLSGRHGDLYMNHMSWEQCLSIAFAFGWKPEGTEAPDFGDDCQLTIPPDKWDNMDYVSNSYQWVKDTDAQKMSAALLRALPAPKTSQLITEKNAVLSETFSDMWEERVFLSIHEGLRLLVETLATFAGGGGFRIE